jgi:hypothetical protein
LCVSPHYPPPPFLTEDLTGRLALETLDEWDNIIKLVLPYVVMFFKVPTIVSSIRLSSHVPLYSSFFAPDNHLFLPLPDEWDQYNIVSLETAHGQCPVFPSAARLLYFSQCETILLNIPSVPPVNWSTAR